MRNFLILIFCFGITTIHAQKMSWRKHAKLAKKQMAEGNYEDAATNYEAAWTKKTKKKEYIYEAAECYMKIKDYRKAAEAYSHIKEENKKFMLPGLKYCRALKMDGQYDEASRAFVYFINGYNGDDKDVVSNIVQDEIRGCELGISMLEKEPADISFEHLSDNVNSEGADFAPVPFSDDVLYYTSNMVGETKMYLTQRNGGVWTRSRVPKNFPKIEAPHFGNGAFSPDNKSFYYTECSNIDASGRMVEDCYIFVTQRDDSGWSKPEKLNNRVNKAGSTNTQPYIIHKDNKEILYFISNRIGGEGGLDIWYSARDLSSEKLDFSKAKNMGSSINSIADEMTPYFDMDENAMYFSSNGRANIGGFDVFKSNMEGENNWSNPTNIGLPYNSNADDYYFRKYASTGGYIVSNRKYGLEKTTFKNDDIFAFSMPTERMMASGNVIDKTTGKKMDEVWVSIYEVTKEGKSKLLENKAFPNGEYQFGLLPGKNYRVEAHQEGFLTEGIQFSTMNNDQMNFTNDLTIGSAMDVNKIDVATTEIVEEAREITNVTEMPTGQANGTFNNPQPAVTEMMESESFSSDSGNVGIVNPVPNATVTTTIVTDPTPVPSTVTTTTVTDYPSNMTTTENYPSATTTTTTPNYSSSTTTSSTSEAGVVYKIQLIAVRKFNDSHSRYNTAKNYGFLETEYLADRNLTRVLLSSFNSKSEADQILMTMKENPQFRTAVVVRYENGVRIDPWQKY